MRVKRLQSDADILAWYARLQKYHETQLTAQRARPARARLVRPSRKRRTPRGAPSSAASSACVGTREVSLLARGRGREPPRSAAARRRRPAAVRGRRHSARRAGLPRRRDRVAAARPVAARQARADVRAHRRARHQPRRPLQARPREQPRLGDDARPRQAGRRRRGRRQRLQRQAALERSHRRQGPRASSRARSTRTASDCVADNGYFVSARSSDAQGGATDIAFVFSSWQKGIESWRFNVPTGARREPDLRASTRVRPHAAARRRDGVDEALRPRSRRRAASRRCRPERLPTRVKIVHQGSGQEFVQPLTWNGAGRSARHDLEHPARRQARRLRRRARARRRRRRSGAATTRSGARARWTSGSFRVEEFRVPLVDARVSGPKAPQVRRVERRRRRADELLLRRRDGVGAAARVGAAEDALAGLRRLRRVQLRAAARSDQDGDSARRATKRARRDARRQADRRQGGAHDRPQRRRDASR